MIELGKVMIKDETSIVEARNKIQILSKDLNFDSIGSTRLATITSELCRLINEEGEESSITVGIEKHPTMEKMPADNEGTYSLKLIFQSKSKDLSIGKAHIFFDEMKTIQTEDGFQHIEALKFIPDPEFKPTDTFMETEREKLMRVSKAELFNEVKRKNEELLEVLNELEKKNTELENATRLKSEFLANMSHELRTPLNSIIGFSGRVIKKTGELLTERQLKNLNTVLRNAHHLLGLINSLLDISKIEAGRMDVFPEEFRLNPLIKEVEELTRSLLIGTELELIADVPDKQTVLYTDKTKLKQTLINLVSNAIKFTDRGSVKISAREVAPSKVGKAAYSDPGMNYMALSVRDTGHGISSEEMKFIFDEFRQVDGSTTRKTGGTGLGLSIAKKFTELLKGEIAVESKKGEGTTFTVTIPARVEEVIERRREGPIREPEAPEPLKAGLTILCIDDDPEALDLLHGFLSDEGYNVIKALSGDEGLEKAEELKPFAITLDIQMPYKDGWSVLNELKANESTRDIPVIIVSIMDNRTLGYQLGATDYLQKPIIPETLIRTIDRILRQEAETILVVDDDPEVIELVRWILEEEKIHVKTAENGVKALESVKDTIPDLILLDLMMPEMDGFEVLSRLKNKEEWAEIPVIIITAKTLKETEKEFLENRVEAIIAKEGMSTDIVLKDISEAMKRLGGEKP